MMDIIRRLRLLKAKTFGPQVGEWQYSTPVIRNGIEYAWRLLPNGTYEYKEFSPEQSYERMADEAW